jgi:hypothetical protein
MAWADGFGQGQEVPTSRKGCCPSYGPFGTRPLFLMGNKPCTSMKEALVNMNTRHFGFSLLCLDSPVLLVRFSSTESFMR